MQGNRYCDHSLILNKYLRYNIELVGILIAIDFTSVDHKLFAFNSTKSRMDAPVYFYSHLLFPSYIGGRERREKRKSTNRTKELSDDE